MNDSQPDGTEEQWSLLDYLPVHLDACPHCGSKHLTSDGLYRLMDPANRPPSDTILGLQPIFIPIASSIVPKAIQILLDTCMDCNKTFQRHMMVVEGPLPNTPVQPPPQNRAQRRREKFGLN